MTQELQSGHSDPRAAAAVVLDAQALERLRELDPDGRHGVLMRVLGAFETSLAQALVQWAAQREAGDAAGVAGLAHAFKSSAASVGALSLAAACAEIERRQRAAPAGEPAVLGQDVQRLIAEGEAALAAVRAMLAP
ncbi:MAG: Hpt domain-containing protein [Rubrivivax sp.]|nr:Hpt domain-containing protein [Rubrivivax sp.]